MNKINLNGFILLVLLIILSMLALLIISSMRTIFLYDKAMYHIEDYRQNYSQLNSVINIIMSNTECKTNCKKQYQNKTWEYVFYGLDFDPCVKVHGVAADLVWLALRETTMQNHTNHTNHTLVVRLALPSKQYIECKTKDIRNVDLGILSWSIV